MAMSLAMDSFFDVFKSPMIQNSIQATEFVNISPINALQPGAPIDFLATAGDWGSSKYINLAESQFIFTVRVRKNGNAAPGADEEVSCIQNLGHSMWAKVQVCLGSTEVGDSNSYYPYEAYFTNLLSKTKDQQNTIMAVEGWWGRDTAGQLAVIRTTDGNAANTGALARHGIIGTGQTVELIMRPRRPIFNLARALPPGLQVRIKFTPVPSPFVLTRGVDNNHSYDLEIISAKFQLCLVTATPTQDVVMKQMRQSNNMLFNLKRVTLKTMTIAAGKTTSELDNIFVGPVPNRILFGMVLSSSIAGGIGSNPLHFQHFNVNEISLDVNGRRFPSESLKPIWTGLYNEAYTGLFKSLHKLNSQIVPRLTREEFGGGYTIFGFDLTASNDCEFTASPQGSGNTRLQLRFSQGLASAITVVMLAEFDDYIQIDKNNQVFTRPGL